MSDVLFLSSMRWMPVIILVTATLGGFGTARADYEDGQRAWDAGRHSEALREWQVSANNGDAKAMLALGRLYVQGLGVPQNYVHAHLWFSLAASRFEAEAVKERDALAARMSPEQVAEAQKLAAAWQPGKTQPAASAPRKPAGPPPPKFIREAQELLAALGYEPDPPDGQWGERTAQAYQAFARDANLPKTDNLTPTALKAMRAKARQAGAVSTPKPKAALPPDALHRAAKAGNLKGLDAALAAGVDVNARDEKGWTALMYAVDKGFVLLVEPLLAATADPDVRAPDGATALFMAVAHGHGEIIPMLMKAGADPSIKGPKGKTATEIAQARYGEPRAAFKKGEPPVIIALLAGTTVDNLALDALKNVLAGLDVRPLTDERRKQLNLPQEVAGVVVNEVKPGSAAESAGLKQGDIIQEVNRAVVKGLADYERIALTIEKEELVVLFLSRRGNNLFVAVYPQ